MTDGINLVLVKPTGIFRFDIIRMAQGQCSKINMPHVAIELFGATREPMRDKDGQIIFPEMKKDDARWPAKCAHCDYVFTESDKYMSRVGEYFGSNASPQIAVLRDALPGWCWDAATWMPPQWRGPDGMALFVRLPDGFDWFVDGPASDCPDLNDHGSSGHPKTCSWKRTGEVPDITVNKIIESPGYCGRVRDGMLIAES